MMGLIILVNDHKGSEELARVADDLDLEIDEILPACDFAQALGLLKVSDGRATLTEMGKKLLAGSIRERKTILRDLLKKTTLFRAITRALESSPEHKLTEEEVYRLIEFTTAPADDYVQNIINWGRYSELFRYDADQRVLLPVRPRSTQRGSPPERPGPPGTGRSTPSTGPGRSELSEPTFRDDAATLVGTWS
jgi:NitT/TauT family transport system ATP-binding protein